MKRTSAAQRRFRYIPEKTDLFLTSFDNYWINWYADLRRKSFISEIVDEILEKKKNTSEGIKDLDYSRYYPKTGN